MDRAAILTTRYPIVLKATADEKAHAVRAVLSFPVHDLVGDYVHADGLNFAPHEADPWVDLEHTGARVGWATVTLKKGGKYSLEWSTQTIDGVQHRLPVGTTYFDPRDRLSAQTFALVARDALPGVSLEFKPDWTVAKSLGPSPLEARNAYEFTRADVMRWTHCAHPVCPGALTLTKSLDPLLKALRDKRVGSEPMHETIYKSLSQYLQYKPVTVAVDKAMPQDMPATDYDPVPDPDDPDTMQDGGDDGPALGGVAAKYQFAQAILDACDKYEADMQSSDSPELRKLAEKFKAMASDLAEKVKGAADKHDAKLNGGSGDDSDKDTDADDDPDMDADEDDGTLKALRPCYYRILKARVLRFTADQIQKGIDEPPAAPPSEEIDALAELAAARREFARELKRTKRTIAICG